MKSATLPPVRVEPEFRQELESVLKKDETLSSFVENLVRNEVAFRKLEADFLERGRASLIKARAGTRTTPAADVIGKLDKMIEAKFGKSRKKPAA